MPTTTSMPERRRATPDLEPACDVPEPRHEPLPGEDSAPTKSRRPQPLHTPEEEAELTDQGPPQGGRRHADDRGVLGFVLPGVVGTRPPSPAAWCSGRRPSARSRTGSKALPEVHKQSLYQINRYLNDLETRYPDATRKG